MVPIPLCKGCLLFGGVVWCEKNITLLGSPQNLQLLEQTVEGGGR